MQPETKAEAPLVSVVVPVFDEAAVIERSLARLSLELERLGQPFELVCVDDGSRDASAALLERAARSDPRVRVLRHRVNRGKGAAVRSGVLAARGAYVLFTDADLSADPAAISELVATLRAGAPVVFGSRRAPGAYIVRPQTPLRTLLGRGFSCVARSVTGLEVRDVTCGLKGFSRAAARDLFGTARVDGWAFDAELAALAATRGIPVRELGVRWRAGEKSAVRVAPAVAAALLDLVRIAHRRLTSPRSRSLPETVGPVRVRP